MEFAKVLLMKYGWQEGQGIGKNANGIVKPIKANLKFDNAGLSYDTATEFTNHWWEKTFDNAAENFKVQNSTENVSFSVKNETAMIGENSKNSPTNKEYSGFFQKSNTDPESESIHPGPTHENMLLKDDKIFVTCEGRTAHKGARHGLSLSGKLKRINAQEKQLLEKNVLNAESAQSIFQSWVQVKRKNKKRNRKISHLENSDLKNSQNLMNILNSSNESNNVVDYQTDDQDYQVKSTSRKRRKQQRNRDEYLANSLSKLSTDDHPKTFQYTKPLAIRRSSITINKMENQHKKQKHRVQHNISSDEENDLTNDELNVKSNGQYDNNNQHKDPIVQQITNVMKKFPSKKFKVIAEELTPFQKKNLRKSGLRIKLKSKKYSQKGRNKERAQVKQINKRIQKILVFNN